MNATETASSKPYAIVIGLEVHVQLQTATKLFCRCSTQFGAPPNTQTCPVCLGLPGALPVMNARAFELAMRTALALQCEIPSFTKWDRKQYYYPDLPKGYQISQFDLPMSQEGVLHITDPKGTFQEKPIRIIRAHLEEDAGKSMHDERAGEADSLIDLNRTGTPLLEIVSYPDMSSPAEAKAYLTELKLLLTYLGVSDCNMQEGSLRVDANINLHIPSDPPGGPAIETPIVEVKNMNSFRAVERAMSYEAERQFELWQQTRQTRHDVPKQTRGWDDQQQCTRGQRHKEESSDYRYFPDPDLPPVVVTDAQRDAVRGELGELPAALRERLQQQYVLDHYSADVLVNQGRELVVYFETLAAASGDSKLASNWVQQEVLRVLNEQQQTIGSFPLSAAQLGQMLHAVSDGKLAGPRAKDVFEHLLAHPRTTLEAAMQELGIEQVDESQLRSLCAELVARNAKIVADVRDGKQQAVGALIGQAKKQNPNANPADVRRICLELILAES